MFISILATAFVKNDLLYHSLISYSLQYSFCFSFSDTQILSVLMSGLDIHSCLFHVPPLQYLCLLLCIFLLEIIAGVLAYITYQEVKCFPFLFGCVCIYLTEA